MAASLPISATMRARPQPNSSTTTRPISRATTTASAGPRPCSTRPRASILVPGLGLFGLGRTKKDARVAADLAEAAVEAITEAEAIGRFSPIGEADMFDVRILVAGTGQARRRRRNCRSPGRSRSSPAQPAPSALRRRRRSPPPAPKWPCSILDGSGSGRGAKSIGGTALSVRCDVTDDASVRAAFDRIVETFGGVDILVSNAGAAFQGRIGDGRRRNAAQELRTEFLLASARGAECGAYHAGAGHRRLPAVQRLETGDQSGTEFRPLRLAESRDPVPRAPICARLWRRRHPRQCGQCRPHPLRPAHRRLHRRARQGPRRQ